MPLKKAPDYSPVGILCSGDHSENRAMSHWCWVSDLCPFGSIKPATSWVADSMGYRYAFNGKENDPTGMGGGGSTYDYGFRIYNAQIGKFLSVDPLTKGYPWYTPYQFAGNMPARFVDLDGLEPADNGAFYGEIRVSPIQGEQNIVSNLEYWVWLEYNKVPYALGTGRWEISTRPFEVIAESRSSSFRIPLVYSELGRQKFINENIRTDVVDNPTIAPTSSGRISSGRYGFTRYNRDGSRKFHDGIDVSADPGIPIRSELSGVVSNIQWQYSNNSIGDNGYGNFIDITTDGISGTITLRYAHLNGVSVKPGDIVNSGSIIGTAGATGNAWDVPNKHVHIRARLNGGKTDPEKFLNTQYDDQGNPSN